MLTKNPFSGYTIGKIEQIAADSYLMRISEGTVFNVSDYSSKNPIFKKKFHINPSSRLFSVSEDPIVHLFPMNEDEIAEFKKNIEAAKKKLNPSKNESRKVYTINL